MLSQGDRRLFNPYGIIAVNPAKHPHVNYRLATALIAYVSGPEGQRIIREFKRFGRTLFVPTTIP